MKRIQLILLLLLGTSFCACCQIKVMQYFDSGDYSVGFKHEILTDYGRSYGTEDRPIQIFIWYPSNQKAKPPINYVDYFLFNNLNKQLWKTGPNRNKKQLDSLIRFEIARVHNHETNPLDFSKYRKLEMGAEEDLPMSQDSFPLVLLAPGGNTSGYIHAVLCEYLASHGYIVASISSRGNADGLRWPFDQTGLNLQIDDMAFVINYLNTSMTQLNIEKTCLMAWSVGGVSQAIYAMKNSNIDMLISLDSGLGRSYGIDMLKASPYFNYRKIQIPYLHLTGNQPEIYQVERSSVFIDSIPSEDKYSLIVDAFAHQHFTSHMGIIPALSSQQKDIGVIEAYVHMGHLVRIFLETYLLKNEDSEEKWMELIKN